MEGEGLGLRERLQQEPRAGCKGGGRWPGTGQREGTGWARGRGRGARVVESGWEPGRRRGWPAEEKRFPPRVLGWRQAGRAQRPGGWGAPHQGAMFSKSQAGSRPYLLPR